MALTQISTGGIKDDAVTDAKLPANSVGNSEMKDDAVGVAELSATGTASSSTFLRGDNSWVTPTDTNTQLSTEEVQDIVGGMFTGNTETNIAATYQDSDGTIDLVSTDTNTQLAFANDANNRVVTGDGSGGLNGEANLTYDGDILSVGTGSGGAIVKVQGAEGGNAELWLQADEGDNDADNWLLYSNASNNKLKIATKASGSYVDIVNFTTAGNIEIEGNIVPASGKGIDFSATSDAGGMTNELLDDYEEGTYTPVLLASGSTSGLTITYSQQHGHYTKIGDLVHYCLEMDWTAKSGGESNSTAYLNISLPFAAKNASGVWGSSTINWNTGLEFDNGGAYCHHNKDGAYIFFWSPLDSGRHDYYVRTSNLHSSGGIRMAGTVKTA